MIFTSSPNKLLRNLLGFKELIVTSHDMLPRKGILHLWVKPHKNGACCPECARRCKLVRRSRSKAARDSRTWRDIPAGETLFRQGDRPEHVWVLLRGRFGGELAGERLADLGPGTIAGATQAVTGDESPVDGVTLEPCRALVWQVAAIEAQLERQPRLRGAFQAAVSLDLARKVQALTRR